MLVATGWLLAGCSTISSMDPINWWHQQQGGKIAKERPAPPGANQPYPNMATVPAKPTPPNQEEMKKLTDSLVADRTNAQHAAQAAPLADPSSPTASPTLFGVGTAPPATAGGRRAPNAAPGVAGQRIARLRRSRALPCRRSPLRPPHRPPRLASRCKARRSRPPPTRLRLPHRPPSAPTTARRTRPRAGHRARMPPRPRPPPRQRAGQPRPLVRRQRCQLLRRRVPPDAGAPPVPPVVPAPMPAPPPAPPRQSSSSNAPPTCRNPRRTR